MAPEVFHQLLEGVDRDMRCHDALMRDSISRQKMLVVTLRVFASGVLQVVGIKPKLISLYVARPVFVSSSGGIWHEAEVFTA